MNTQSLRKSQVRSLLGLSTALVLAFLLIPLGASNAQERLASARGETKTKVHPSSMTRSGSLYKTTVTRNTEGKLIDEDVQQVSLLGSRIIKHINGAAEGLVDENPDEAKAELDQANALVTVIRDTLPVTTIETVVNRADDGKEVYRNSERVQDDLIPIFESRIAIEVMEPILDAKKDSAAVKGLRLADSDLIYTSILLDLSYVERKIKRGLSLIDEHPERALAQIVLAQNTGVRLSMASEDHPLVQAQSALRIAQRMAEQERYEAAKSNLTLVRNHLELYRGTSESAHERVKDLDDDIQTVIDEIENSDSAQKIGAIWDRLTGWFRSEASVARSTENESASDTASR